MPSNWRCNLQVCRHTAAPPRSAHRAVEDAFRTGLAVGITRRTVGSRCWLAVGTGCWLAIGRGRLTVGRCWLAVRASWRRGGRRGGGSGWRRVRRRVGTAGGGVVASRRRCRGRSWCAIPWARLSGVRGGRTRRRGCGGRTVRGRCLRVRTTRGGGCVASWGCLRVRGGRWRRLGVGASRGGLSVGTGGLCVASDWRPCGWHRYRHRHRHRGIGGCNGNRGIRRSDCTWHSVSNGQ